MRKAEGAPYFSTVSNSILDIASLPMKHEARMNELPGTHIEGKDKLTGVLIGSQH